MAIKFSQNWQSLIDEERKAAATKASTKTTPDSASNSDYGRYQGSAPDPKASFEYKPPFNATGPTFEYAAENLADNIDFLKDFALKIEDSFASLDLNSLTAEQRRVVMLLRGQDYVEKITQIAEAAISQEEKKEQLEELAKDLFVMACASKLDIAEVIEFKNQLLAREIVLDEKSLLNDYRENVAGLNALSAALAANRNLEDLEALIATGCNIHHKSPEGNNFAHFVAMFGLGEEYINFAVAQGVDINLRNKAGKTPLDIAMGMGDREGLVEALIAKGARSGSLKMEMDAEGIADAAKEGAAAKAEAVGEWAAKIKAGKNLDPEEQMELSEEGGRELSKEKSLKGKIKDDKAGDKIEKLRKLQEAAEKQAALRESSQAQIQMLLAQEEEELAKKRKESQELQRQEFEKFFRAEVPVVTTTSAADSATIEKNSPSQEAIRREIEKATGVKIDDSEVINLDKMLFHAVSSGNSILALLLKKLGADVNYQENGDTILEVAIRMGGSSSLIETLANGANSDTIKSAAEMIVQGFNNTLQGFFGLETETQKHLKELEEVKQKAAIAVTQDLEIKQDPRALEAAAAIKKADENEEKKVEISEVVIDSSKTEESFGLMDIIRFGIEALSEDSKEDEKEMVGDDDISELRELEQQRKLAAEADLLRQQFLLDEEKKLAATTADGVAALKLSEKPNASFTPKISEKLKPQELESGHNLPPLPAWVKPMGGFGG